MNFYAFCALTNTIIFIFLTIILLFKKNKPPAAVYLMLFIISGTFWSLCYYFWQTSSSHYQALFWLKMLMIGATFAAPTFLHFAVVVTKKERANQLLISSAYLLAIISSYFNLFSAHYLTGGLETKLGIPYFPTGGLYFTLHIIQWTAFLIIAFLFLYRSWKKAPERTEEKEFLKVLTVSTLISFGAASVNNFLWFNIPIPPVTMLVVGAYAITVTFLLLKGKFYKINLFYFEYAAGLIVMISVLQFILAQKINRTAINVITAIVVIFISYFLLTVGRRERTNLEKINNLNAALNSSIENIINSINSAIIIIDERRNIIESNKLVLKLFGHVPIHKPATYLGLTRGHTNRCLMESLDEYSQNGRQTFSCIIETPDIKQLDVYFSPFTIKKEVNATIAIITERKPPWGTVYDSATLQPIPLVIVRLFEIENKKLRATKVTDNLGRFDFIAGSGNFIMTADKENYAKGVSKKQIGYQGEPIVITKDNVEGVNVNIVLDPL